MAKQTWKLKPSVGKQDETLDELDAACSRAGLKCNPHEGPDRTRRITVEGDSSSIEKVMSSRLWKNKVEKVAKSSNSHDMRKERLAHLRETRKNASQTMKMKGDPKLNTMVELKVNVLEGGWDPVATVSVLAPLYHAKVLFSAKVSVRMGMGFWHTLYADMNVKGLLYSDPGGGFYLKPQSGRFHKDTNMNSLISDILEEVVYKEFPRR